MKSHTTIGPAARHDGFSYIEAVLAVLLLSVCLVPALNAVRSAIAAPLAAQNSAQGLACVKSQMERVMAEPYRSLLAAAGSDMTTASPVYSLAADASCPIRNVFIAMYDASQTPPVFSATDTGLLYLTVSSPDPSTTPVGVGFSFSTLVRR